MPRPHKVLFLQATSFSTSTTGNRIAQASAGRSNSIEVHFYDTSNKELSEITRTVIAGGFDAVVTEETYRFSNGRCREDIRDSIYAELGLNFENSPFVELDQNYLLSGVALVRYLKQACAEAGQDMKFGYMGLTAVAAIFASHYDALGIEPNADFYLCTGRHTEGPRQHVDKIYASFGVR